MWKRRDGRRRQGRGHNITQGTVDVVIPVLQRADDIRCGELHVLDVMNTDVISPVVERSMSWKSFNDATR